jgi:PII-like signaling protein
MTTPDPAAPRLTDAVRLRVYLGESDHSAGHPTFEAVVMAARQHGLAGATAQRGLLGFGHSHRVHSAKILQLSEDLPVVVDIVDRADKIEAFLPVLQALLPGSVMTWESVKIVEPS